MILLEFDQYTAKINRRLVMIILVALILWPFVNAKTIVAGFAYGTTVSLISFVLLKRYINRAVKLSVIGGKSFLRVGTFLRILLMISSIMIAYELPLIFNYKAAGLGLLAVPIVSHFDSIANSLNNIIKAKK